MRTLIVIAVAGLFVLTTAAFVRRHGSKETARSEQVQERPIGRPVAMVRFVLFKNGIQPRQMRIRAGMVNIAVEDRSDASSGLVIQRTAGAEIVQIRKVPNDRRGRQLISLEPGQYTVYDASLPNNQAELIVQP